MSADKARELATSVVSAVVGGHTMLLITGNWLFAAFNALFFGALGYIGHRTAKWFFENKWQELKLKLSIMNKSTVFAVIQAVLMVLGSFLVNHNIFGIQITESIWTTLAGIVVSVVTTIWGFSDHTTTIESFQSTIRNFFSFAGGFLVSKGFLNADQLTAILGSLTTVGAVLYGVLSKRKSQLLQSGALKIDQLKK